MSVTALQDDFQRLQVSRSIENGPIEWELPNESTAPATESLSPLDLFIRDLDERKGKLPYCQEVTDIQTSVEKFIKVLLLGVEKKLPFYKTTLANSGSFYEGTKVGKPDKFDYFVQLDNFSRPKDILYEELAHCMVMVIPVITCQPNDCCLRCSQSCLEQSLFRDHFGPVDQVFVLGC